MQREKLATVGSGVLFGLAIIFLPDQFLFLKTIQNSFWTEYFPLPFGGGWFIAFIVMTPVVWVNDSISGAIRGSILSLVPSILAAVPISLSIIGDALSPNNLLNQYFWVGIIFVPPLLMHIIVRWAWSRIHSWRG